MRTAVIDAAGVVVNVIAAGDDVYDPGAGFTLVPSDTAAVGDHYADGIFSAPPAPIVIPQEVTMRQARLALLGAGALPAVDAALAALPSPYREAAQIDWEYAATVRRDSSLVLQLGPALGLTEAQIDHLFIMAATL